MRNEVLNGPRKSVIVARRDEQADLAVYELRNSADGESDRRHTKRHRVDQ